MVTPDIVTWDTVIYAKEFGIDVGRLFVHKLGYRAIATVSKVAEAVVMREPELCVAGK